MSNTLGYIYLIYLREFVNANLDIYKIGCSEDIDRRTSQYPKKSICVFSRFKNYKEIENQIKAQFDLKYICRRDIGREYYQGNHHDMIDQICKIINEFNTFRKKEPLRMVFSKKTLVDFCDDVLEYDIGMPGLSMYKIYHYYINYWFEDNIVDYVYENCRDFVDDISKIIGKPVDKVFVGQKWSSKVNTHILEDIDLEDIDTDESISMYNGFIDLHLEKAQSNTDFVNQQKVITCCRQWFVEYDYSYKFRKWLAISVIENVYEPFYIDKKVYYNAKIVNWDD